MPKSKEVDAYLAELTPERKEILIRLRSLVFEVVPDADEMIRYGMPFYEIDGHTLCAYASQKRYVSLYIQQEFLDQHRDELEGLNLGKACIRFTKLEKLPMDAVRTMLREVVAAAA